MNISVIAVVVTFNRKDLLIRCIDALLNQTHKLTKIIVIDNASTDGTFELLSEGVYHVNPLIDCQILDINVGGAGGFNIGTAKALTLLPDQIWLMDDDGWPDLFCLSELLSIPGDVRAPIIIDDQDNTKTSFSYNANGEASKDVDYLSKFVTLTPVHAFNGVLLSEKLISKIGLPDANFFIWGDELDYRKRWLANDFIEISNPKAKFFHPSDRQVISRSNNKSLGVPMQCSRIRKYCYYRNQTTLTKRGKGIIRTIVKIIFTLPDIAKYETDKKIFTKATYHGLFEIFGCHGQYLK